ncbi:hypothetical protein Tco_0508998 [Tanacetum coccineum]
MRVIMSRTVPKDSHLKFYPPPKKVAEEELGQQSSKKQNSDELSQEEIQQLMIIVPEEGMNIETLQTKYPIINYEVYTDDLRMYWKIIRVGNHTEERSRTSLIVETKTKTRDQDPSVDSYQGTKKVKSKQMKLIKLEEPNSKEAEWVQETRAELQPPDPDRGKRQAMGVTSEGPLKPGLMDIAHVEKPRRLHIDELMDTPN